MQLPVPASRLIDRSSLTHRVAQCGQWWALRNRAVRSSRYGMKDLVALDRRIEEGRASLLQHGDDSWSACSEALACVAHGPDPRAEDADAREGRAGLMFAAALLAFSARRADHIRQVCEAALPSPAGQRALVAALAWLPFEPLAPTLQRFASSADARLRRIAVRAFGLHRRDPCDVLKPALLDEDPSVAAAAARGLGESRRHDALPLLASRSSVAPEPARFGMLVGLLLLGCRDALAPLETAVEAGDGRAMPALDLVLRCLPAAQGRQLLSRLSAQAGTERLVVAGTGMLGDPVAVPWLINKLRDPALCHIASEAFCLITGAQVDRTEGSAANTPVADDLLAGPPPADEAPRAASDGSSTASDAASPSAPHPDDQSLPRLDPDQAQAWWEAHGHALSPGSRHLCGRAITPSLMLDILRTGDQRQRRAAALEWALLDGAHPLFDVRQRSDGQLRALNAGL